LDKTEYKKAKKQLKAQRLPLKKRVGKILNRAKYPFVVVNKKVGNKIHKKRNGIRELKVKVDYIVDSLKTTLNTTDEIRKKTIEDIVQNIDDL
jgi:hypothetical protein